MQIEAHKLYPIMFLLGHRQGTDGQTLLVGSVIVKGTFQDLDAPTPVWPQAAQVPIFLKDVPFNVVQNSDFEAVKPLEANGQQEILFWEAVGGRLEPNTDNWVGSTAQSAKLTSLNGPCHLTQTVTFDEPVGGRTFTLSFYAKAEILTTITGCRLQAVDSGEPICELSASLTNEFQRFTSSPGTWAAGEAATDIEIILAGTDDPTNTVYFDRVQVEEGSATRWDEETVFRYEHDLVPYKPNADVIVLGAAQLLDNKWSAMIETDTGRRMVKKYETEEFPLKTTFGWASRGQAPRLAEAGDPERLKSFKPSDEQPLPPGFQNAFYNGYDRNYDQSLSTGEPFPYFPDGARLTITSQGETIPPPPVTISVQLPSSRPRATLTVLNDLQQEEDQNIPLLLDTVIIEPELDRYIVVWRGSWPFEPEKQERYLKLTVQGGP